MKINLNIDRLVLEGFDKENISNIDNSIKEELARLFNHPHHDSSNLTNRDIDSVDKITLDPSQNQHDSDFLGTAIAKSIYSSLGNDVK